MILTLIQLWFIFCVILTFADIVSDENDFCNIFYASLYTFGCCIGLILWPVFIFIGLLYNFLEFLRK